MKGQPKQDLVHDSVEPNELWHRRLEHVHYRALPIASKAVEGLPKIQAKHEGVCKGCAKGKNTKKTFPSSESKDKRNLGNHPLRCMQSYVIKFTKRVCILNVYFIDDFSRKTWVYFMKNKDEVFSKFKEFKALIEN